MPFFCCETIRQYKYMYLFGNFHRKCYLMLHHLSDAAYIPYRLQTKAHLESNYSSYHSNYSSIRTSIVATIVLLEINGWSEHRYSSRLSGFLL